MSGPTVAVIGAYGDIGERLCAELLARQPAVRLVVGGRDPARAASLARRLGGRASGQRIDAFAPDSLGRALTSAELAVNCAGPSAEVADRVARAAIEHRCDLVDVGGDEQTVGERAGRWADEEASGQLILLDAGWIPGVSGLLAAAVDERATNTLDRVRRLAVYCGDRGPWSATGMADVLAVARSMQGPGHFRAGAWRPVSLRRGLSRVRLPAPFGSRLAVMSRLGELRGLSARRPDRVVEGHLLLMVGPRAGAAFGLGIGPLRRAPGVAARLLAAAARADQPSHGGGGIVVAVADGERLGRPERIYGIATTSRGAEVTGSCGALVADAMLRGELAAEGYRYLCDAVEPEPLLDRLRPAGLEYAISG